MVITGLMLFSTACEDEALSPYVEPLSGVHAYAKLTESSPGSFLIGDLTNPIEMNIQWVSVDRELEVNQIEIYVLFNENYVDEDGNPLVAAHGGSQGLLFKTIDASGLANRENTLLTISQQDVFNLYQDATFDYDDDGTAVSVFDNDFKPSRSTTNPFIDGDNFELRWELTTADGLLFDSWSPSICTEFNTYQAADGTPNDGGFNCTVGWILECGQVINEPAQDYTIALNDSYGDGWNGAAISVIVDGVATQYTLPDGLASTEVVTVPTGTTDLSFDFISGEFDSEVTYTITSGKGNVIAAAGPSPAVGPITLNLCSENL